MNKKLKTLIAWMLVWALAGADIAAIAATLTLPESLKTIADDAFADTTDLTVSAEKGTDAYDWAVEKGYISEEADQMAPVVRSAFSENGTVIHG